MNKAKIIKILTKLATRLDESGKFNYASNIDQIILKVAEDLQPVGKIFEKNEKFYQQFYSSKGLVVKEVDKDGKIIGEKQETPPTTVQQDESWLSGFYDLISALGGNRGEAQQKIETKMKEDETEDKEKQK